MPSLRTLLNTFDPSGLDAGTAPRWQRDTQLSQYFLASYGLCGYCTELDNDCWGDFCIEDSMQFVTLELWGAGGGGAGGCCCSWGPPGGAGAYARLLLDNSANGYSGNHCMCFPSAGCCSPNSCCGYRGCTTYWNGPGVSNLCAEGGQGGCGICFFFNCFPNGGCGVLEHPCANNNACYYGAAVNQPNGVPETATGATGEHGWLQTDVCCSSNWCYYKVALPVPAGLGTQATTYKVTRAFCNTGTQRDDCRRGSMFNDHVAGGGGRIGPGIGVGGTTARVCGGGCCCGWRGGPGLIKVSWT